MKFLTTLILCVFFQGFSQDFSKEALDRAVQEATEELAREKNLDRDKITVQSVNIIKGDKKSSKYKFFVIWGYNRSWHSPSSATFNTDHGQFTIHDAQAKDRPSPFDFETYFSPSKISIPQYNLRLGVEKTLKNGSVGVEVGTDHMKWVFEKDKKHRITGDYNKPVWTYGPNGEIVQMNFDLIKENQDARPFHFEYSDGHNYVHLNTFYNLNAFSLFKGKIKSSIGVEAGAGAYIPKPMVKILTQNGSYQGDNGKFQLAGYGFHAGARTRLTFFDRIFVESSLRAVTIKSKAKIYSPEPMTIEQDWMKSRQFYVGLGVVIKNFQR